MAARSPGAAGADDDRVVGVEVVTLRPFAGHFDGSNVNTITVPSTNSMKPRYRRSMLIANRTPAGRT